MLRFKEVVGEIDERLITGIGGRRNRRFCLSFLYSILYSLLRGTLLDTVLAGEVAQIGPTR